MVTKFLPFGMLFSRLALFAFFQLLIAAFFRFMGHQNPWHESEGYWVLSGLLANLVGIVTLKMLFRTEGLGYFENFRFIKTGWWKDVLLVIGLMIVAAPLTMLPNIYFAKLFLGSTQEADNLFFRPLPLAIIISGFLWAITQGFAELPTYFTYCMPRLAKQIGNNWIAWALASFFLALQHIALPLIFDFGFIMWRFTMFLPFAFFIGWCLKVRPRLTPYLMIAHALLDVGAVMMLFSTN